MKKSELKNIILEVLNEASFLPLEFAVSQQVAEFNKKNPKTKARIRNGAIYIGGKRVVDIDNPDPSIKSYKDIRKRMEAFLKDGKALGKKEKVRPMTPDERKNWKPKLGARK